MYEFLNHVLEKELLQEVNRKINSVVTIKNELDSGSEVLRILFAVFGYDILYEASIRKLILLNCEDEVLYYFCDEFGIDKKNKKYDIANELSTMSWRSGAKIVKLFKQIFKVSKNYLPAISENQRRLEVINGKECLGELFDYQNEISLSIKNFLASNKVSCLIQMPTGSGKTRTTLDSVIEFMLERIKVSSYLKVLWLAHSEELLEQAVQTLKNIWHVKGEDDLILGRLWGGYDSINEIDEVDVMFVGYMKMISLYKNNNIKYCELINSYDLIIVDEAHKSASNILSILLEEFKTIKEKKIIGITATPGRSVHDYDENRKLTKLYDGNLITSKVLGENPIKLLQDRHILSKLVRIEKRVGVDIELTEKELSSLDTDPDISSSILKKLANNKKRNLILLKSIKDEVKKNKLVIVFCCSVEHSKKISVMLASEGVISAAIDYGMRVSARRYIVEDFKAGRIKVLLNFGIFTTGLDVPKLDTVIISRPTSSIVLYSQMIGRGIRGSLVGGTTECRLIDIRDNFQNYGDIDTVYNYFENDWSD